MRETVSHGEALIFVPPLGVFPLLTDCYGRDFSSIGGIRYALVAFEKWLTGNTGFSKKREK